MNFECMIVDDEPLAIRVLMKHLEKIQDLHLKATAGNAFEAIEKLNRYKIDLIFLDIDMPELTGMDLIKSLHHKPHFIFTTAFREYAAEAFEVDAVDYLVKPVSFPRFVKAVEKFRSQVKKPAPEEDAMIRIRADRQTHNISVSSILFIEGLKDYIKIHVDSGKVFITHKTMAAMEEELQTHGFIRCHKSWLVAVSRIKSFTSEFLTVEKKQIPIGKRYRKSVSGFLSA